MAGRKYEMGADESNVCCVVFCVRECVLGLTAPTLQQNRGGSRRQEPVPLIPLSSPDDTLGSSEGRLLGWHTRLD
jgi:hypothetical protein